MIRRRFLLAVGLLGCACLCSCPACSSQPTVAKGKTAVEARTGRGHEAAHGRAGDPNCEGLGKLLSEKPKDAEAWGFARGQALLMAETGNLLMCARRKTATGEEPWMQHAAALREAGATLARTRRPRITRRPVPHWRGWPTCATAATRPSACRSGLTHSRGSERANRALVLDRLGDTSSLSRALPKRTAPDERKTR